MFRCFLLFIAIVSSVAQAVPDPYVILPGQGFGQFRAALGLVGLEKLTRPGEFGEGETGGQPSANIFMMEPKKRVIILIFTRFSGQ